MRSGPVSISDTDLDPWDDVVGQASAVARLRAAVASPVHAFLLHGPAGSGKRAAARAFAAELLAAGTDDPDRHMRLALAEQHPDLFVVEPAGARISIAQCREVVQRAARSPIECERQVVVMAELDRIEDVGAVLLKTIEEPPPTTVFVLLADEIVPEIVTIASRAVRIEFAPVPAALLSEHLGAEGVDPERARTAADAAAGSLARARLLATDDALAARLEAWRTVPDRLDGSGAAVAVVVAELREHIDRAQEPLVAAQLREVEEVAEEAERYGVKATGRRELETRQRRGIRRLRTEELRAGLATLSRRYRDELASANDPGPILDGLDAIQHAAEELIRNPNEALFLQGLFVRLPPL